MSKFAKVGNQFFTHDTKRGWVDATGEVVTVAAEHGTKFFATEEAAVAAGFKPNAKPAPTVEKKA